MLIGSATSDDPNQSISNTNSNTDCADGDQKSYRGTISQTSEGLTCQAWSSQTPHGHSRTPEKYPSSGLDENYCRNPDGEPEGAWCYTGWNQLTPDEGTCVDCCLWSACRKTQLFVEQGDISACSTRRRVVMLPQ